MKFGRACESGFSLIEVMLAVVLIAVISMIAIPRFDGRIVGSVSAMSSAREVVGDMRLCRSLAISRAATNPSGYSVQMQGGSPYTGYAFVNSGTGQVIEAKSFPGGITATGHSQYSFGPLGSLLTGSGTRLAITGGSRSFQIDVNAANGSAWITEL